MSKPKNQWTVFLGIGFELIGIVLVFFFIGQQVDPYLGIRGLGIGLSVLVGFVIWFIRVISLLRNSRSS